MLEGNGETINNHNYAYHINITGAAVDAGDIRLDWEYYFEGSP